MCIYMYVFVAGYKSAYIQTYLYLFYLFLPLKHCNDNNIRDSPGCIQQDNHGCGFSGQMSTYCIYNSYLRPEKNPIIWSNKFNSALSILVYEENNNCHLCFKIFWWRCSLNNVHSLFRVFTRKPALFLFRFIVACARFFFYVA